MAFSKSRITLLASVPLILYSLHTYAKKALSIYIQRLDDEALFLIAAKKRCDEFELYRPHIEQTVFRQTYAVLEERNCLVSSVKSAGLGTVGHAFLVSPKVIKQLLIGRECEAEYRQRRWTEIIATEVSEWKEGPYQGIWGYESENEEELSNILEGNAGTVIDDADNLKDMDVGLDDGEGRDDTSWRLSCGRMRPGDIYNYLIYKMMELHWVEDDDSSDIEE